MGLEGHPSKEGYTQILLTGCPHKEAACIDTVALSPASLSPPRTRTQGWIMMARSKVLSLDETHLWQMGT